MHKPEQASPALRFPEFNSPWCLKKIKNVSPLQRGFDLPTSNVVEGEYPVVYSNGILRSHNAPKAKGPGVVTGRSGTIGKVTFVEDDYWPHNTSLWVTDFNGNDPKYIYYMYSELKLERYNAGSTVPTLNRNDVHSVKIHIPKVKEQQKIASFLTAVDEKIAQLQKKKDLLEDYKKGCMQKLFSQRLRFTDDNGTPFPDWENYKANEIFSNHSNKAHDGSLPIIAVTQDQGAVFRDTLDKDIQTSSASISSYKIIETGDFIISLRSFQGGIEYSRITGICSPAYTILKPTKNIIDDFYRHYLKKESFISQLSATVVGIREGKQISYSAFGTLHLPYPQLKEQKKIADFLSSIDDKIALLAEELNQAKTFKKGLLQQMFV